MHQLVLGRVDRLKRGINCAFTLLIFSLFFYLSTKVVAEPDLWGHVKYGLDILHSGHIAQVDPYGYTSAGYHWIDHEWMSEAIFAWAYEHMGNAGLALVKVILNVSTAGIIYLFLRCRSYDGLSAATFCFIALLMMAPGTCTVRPHLFTYLFLGLLMLALYAIESGKSWWLIILPLIFLVWINAHPGAFAGLALLSVWTATFLLRRFYLRSRKYDKQEGCPSAFIIAAVLASFLMVVINPYGIGLLWTLLDMCSAPHMEITEWNPIVIRSWQGIVYLLVVALTCFAWCKSKAPKSPSLFVMYCICAIMPLLAQRHMPLFALVMVFTSSDHVADIWKAYLPKTWNVLGRYSERTLAILLSVCLIGMVYSCVQGCSRFGQVEVESNLPAAAVQILRESQVKADVVCDFDWGQYLIWHLSPNIKFAMDGRCDTAYPKQVYFQYLALMHGIGQWDNLFKSFHPDIVLTSKNFSLINLMRLKQGWVSVYEDGTCTLFAKTNGQCIRAIQAYLMSKPVIQTEQRTFP